MGWPSVLEVAGRNGVRFAILEQLRRSGVDIGPWADEHLRLDRAKLDLVASVVSKICESALSRGLPCVPIKTFMEFPYVDHDVDLLAVDQAALPEYKKLLSQTGWNYQFSKSRLREPYKYFFYPTEGLLPGAGVDLKIHLHAALSWNGVVYLDSERLWSRCVAKTVQDASIVVPSPEDEILIMAAHAVHENRCVKLSEVVQFVRRASDDLDWSYIWGIAEAYHWRRALGLFLDTIHSFLRDNGVGRRPVGDAVAKQIGEVDSCSHVLRRRLPILLPCFGVTRCYMEKLMADCGQLPIGDLFREIIAYTLADWYQVYRLLSTRARSGTGSGR